MIIEELLDKALSLIAEKGNCDILKEHNSEWVDSFINEMKNKGIRLLSSYFVQEQVKRMYEDREIFNEIIEKLDRDKYIHKNLSYNSLRPHDKMYFLTIEGRLFLNTGGYVKSKQTKGWEHRRIIIESWGVIVGGGSAFVYYFLLPLLRHYHLLPRIWNAIYWLLSCGK